MSPYFSIKVNFKGQFTQNLYSAVVLLICLDCCCATCQVFRNIGRRERVALKNNGTTWHSACCVHKKTHLKNSTATSIFRNHDPGYSRQPPDPQLTKVLENTVHASTQFKNDNICSGWYKHSSSVQVEVTKVHLLQKQYRGNLSFSMNATCGCVALQISSDACYIHMDAPMSRVG